MKVDKLNSWLTLSANIGVLIGILILIIELQQNTRATEAEVAWAHTAAAQQLFLPVAMDADMAEFLAGVLQWSAAEIESNEQEFSVDYVRAERYAGVLFNYYQSRYYTQPSDDEQRVLLNQIRTDSRTPFIKHFLDANLSTTYESEFRDFIVNIRENL